MLKLLLPVLFILIYLGLPANTSAETTVCQLSSNVNQITPSTTADITFTVQNQGVSTIRWVRIVPSDLSAFTINGTDSTSVNIEPNNSGSVNINVTTGAYDNPPVTFTVFASEESDGNNSNSCSSTDVSITSDSQGPSITSVQVAIASSYAVISWNTDEPSRTTIQYGSTDAFGQNLTNSNYATSHEITIPSLSSSQTYYGRITATDTGGNSSDSNTFSFTTSAAAVNTVTTVTIETTPAPSADTTKPRLVISAPTDLSSPFSRSQTITGEAFDTRSIAKVEYSLDSGKSYIIVPNLSGLNTSTASFNFRPVSKDGKYKIILKATDSSGNSETVHLSNWITDSTPPVIKINTDISKPLPPSPQIRGQVTDKNGLAKVEYSLDSGANWSPVDLDLNSPTQAEFTIATNLKLDGNYSLVIKACDLNENCQPLSSQLVIDRLPPVIGQILLHRQHLVIDPHAAIPAGTPLSLTTSVIGGPTSVKLNGQSMSPVPGSTLWTIDLGDSADLASGIHLEALDGAGNLTKQSGPAPTLTPLPTVASSKPVTLTVHTYDPGSESFFVWSGPAFDQTNPQVLTETGAYSLLLPPGTYYLKFSSPGHLPAVSDIFTVTETTFLTDSLALKPAWLGLIWPWQSTRYQVKLSPPAPAASAPTVQSPETLTAVSGQTLQLRGTASLVSITPLWHPQSFPQLRQLSDLSSNSTLQTIVIVPHATDSEIKLLQKRSGYSFNFVADPDGQISRFWSPTYGPAHFLLNSRGQVTRQLEDYLSSDQINQLIE